MWLKPKGLKAYSFVKSMLMSKNQTLKHQLVHKVTIYAADYPWVELNHLTASNWGYTCFQYLDSSSVCTTMLIFGIQHNEMIYRKDETVYDRFSLSY